MNQRFLACCLLISACSAPLPASPISTVDGKALLDFERIRSVWFEAISGTNPDKFRGGQDNQAAAFVGREDLILAKGDQDFAPAACEARPGDPIAEIAKLASKTSIVIINEAHDSPQHRQFVGELLQALWPLGYNTYAAETFSADADLRGNWARLGDGFYSSEPIFGRVLTAAKRTGFRLVAYDQTPEQRRAAKVEDGDMEGAVVAREITETENLMRHIFHEDPDARVVIHVGYQHAQERAKAGDIKWMAERLAAVTGRDPLTISQTDCLSASSAIALAKDTHGAMDLYVAHPVIELKDQRPAWRQDMGDVSLAVPADLAADIEPVIIEARLVDAPVDAVPIDRLLVRPGETLPLLLPPGRYRVEAITAQGARTYSAKVLVVRRRNQ